MEQIILQKPLFVFKRINFEEAAEENNKHNDALIKCKYILRR